MKARQRLVNFEARSVMLFATWVIGGAAGLHGPMPSPAPSRQALQISAAAPKADVPAAAGQMENQRRS